MVVNTISETEKPNITPVIIEPSNDNTKIMLEIFTTEPYKQPKSKSSDFVH